MPSVIYAPAYRRYSFGDEHPFSPVRTDMMLDLVAALGHRVETVEPEPATREDLLDVHEDAYVCRVEKLSAGALVPDGQEYGLGTQDTPSFPGMDEAARWLVGGTLHGARLISEGTERRVLQLGGGAASRAPQLRVGFLHLQRPRDRDQLPHPERTEGGLSRHRRPPRRRCSTDPL